ncbi:MAG TPA: antitoxin Xre/MbcA/ParS toxin-binding domain-containing protein [Acidimicrobiales bacterium]|nr:antitoxin Xre/MbcA/ParS toxin-binding domain-containing protein [Acidimicrobiales bacterium]
MTRTTDERVEAVIEAQERAYKESVQRSAVQIAAQLLEMVGQRIAAVGVGLSDARPIRAWAAGGEIRSDNEEGLRLLYRVARSIQLVYDEETARAFLRSSSPFLGDRSPLEVVAEGDARAVLEAVRAFLED